MFNIKSLLVTVLFCASVFCCPGKTIRINSQQDFDKLNQQLYDAINQGNRTIKVTFASGVYYYSENHVSLKKIEAKSADIILKGKGVTLVPIGGDYSTGDLFQGRFSPDISVIDLRDRKDIPCWEYVRCAETRVELVDARKNLWRLKCSSLINLTKEECRNIHAIITCWYTSYTLQVDHISDGYLYFISTQQTFNDSYNCYFLDSDYGYCGRFARIKLCNYDNNSVFLFDHENIVRSSIKQSHVCAAGTFLCVDDCTIHSLKVSGFTFLGASAKNNKSYLVSFRNTQSNCIVISKCRFEGMKNHVAGVENTDNFLFTRNTVSNCYRGGVYVDNGSKGAHVVNNVFSYCGLSLRQDLAVSITGEDYLISDNTFYNYGYAAIGVGVWHGHTMANPSSGVIEGNEIFCTSDYLKDIDNYGLMDSGAIYVSTQNDRVVIRGNYIHDIGGIKDNRGIFCDDGARNVSIYSNVITNTLNCFCIDSRRVASHENTIGPTNVGNVIRDNVIEGNIRFEAKEGSESHCQLGTNYFLVKDGFKMAMNTYKNLNSEVAEVCLPYILEGGKYVLMGNNENCIKERKVRGMFKRLLYSK